MESLPTTENFFNPKKECFLPLKYWIKADFDIGINKLGIILNDLKEDLLLAF